MGKTPQIPPSQPLAKSDPRSEKAALIARQVEILFSAYRRADYEDPRGFILQLGSVLEDYRDDVIIHVTSPKTGIQRRLKWPPSIAEVVEACDACEESFRQAWKSEQERAPIENRLALPAPPPPPKMTVEEMEAKLGRKLGSFARRVEPAPVPRNNDGYAGRALADLEARKLRREAEASLGG
jgi:hypothetical protein